ncbi:MAG: Lrp/AsnC family transcriptional regulator [Candidatus ainarchaeum sp.]|nr:Lrp/AsnC family transcriptional regulator [Candidatus ainarchaeum sp.]
MVYKPNLIDKKILYFLNSNCRLSNAYIGKKCNLSKQRIKSRIEIMQREKIIEKFIVIFDNEKLNSKFYNIYFELNQESIGNNQLFEKIIKLKSTCWVSKGLGKWNLIVCILAQDIKEFRQNMGELFNLIGEYVIDFETFTVIDAFIFPYKVLFENINFDEKFYGTIGNTMKRQPDQIDLQIMNELSQNARISITELAIKLKQNKNTIAYRLKNIIQDGVISKFTTLMNLSNLNINWYYILMNIILTTENEKLLMKELKSLSGVFYIMRGVGNYNICFEIHTKSSQNLEEQLNSIRTKFNKIIKKLDIMEITKEYKCDFFPQDLLR